MKKSFTISIPARRFWRVVAPLTVLVMALGALLGVLVVDRLIMPKVVGVSRDTVEVPGVTGLPFEGARQKLYEVGLLCSGREREFDDSVPEGHIVRQAPSDGVRVKKGRQIDVVVSLGREVGVVPRMKKMSEHQARIELRKNGFTVGKVTKKYDDDVPVDEVISALPEQGATVSREMPVDLTISNGPKPTHVEMPNIVGEGIGDAKAKLADAGLSLGKVEYANNPSLVPGTVVSQSTPPGTSIPFETAVNVVVSVITK